MLDRIFSFETGVVYCVQDPILWTGLDLEKGGYVSRRFCYLSFVICCVIVVLMDLIGLRDGFCRREYIGIGLFFMARGWIEISIFVGLGAHKKHINRKT